ncbi:hypothetical protein [Streptomyces dysideae]|uniref:UDP-glucose/GDP-mannose dehydrogenase C-terminal domain-containing protein n=1 Tax=Streptomyces dysideae TaxID=909626 RepID=A0A101V1G1_9ACTN|nr:hypothetical protein [Streptomyces dysideae]KUO20688.1 hypothetical protein AQJ91_12220 [Streptomyces dysideae]
MEIAAEINGADVLLLGVTYKEDVADLRASLVVLTILTQAHSDYDVNAIAERSRLLLDTRGRLEPRGTAVAARAEKL